jgi:SAM-dependent methyltransferase
MHFQIIMDVPQSRQYFYLCKPISRMVSGIIKEYFVRIKEFLRYNSHFLRPNPKNYSTTDNLTIVPVQREAYFLALNKYVNFGDNVLDVGFGLGYGITILSIKADSVQGIDIDKKCVEYCKGALLGRNPKLISLDVYNGKRIPFDDKTFDIVTCIDVLEHVEDYEAFLLELMRVSRRGVFISTPNRRSENTNGDGTPKNYWHIREWNYSELDKIVIKCGSVEWNMINGNGNGPFTLTNSITDDTQALAPFILIK